MKKVILILVIAFLTLFGIKSFSQDEYPWMFEARISYLMWDNSEISNYYGGMAVFGGNAAKQISEDFKIEVFGDFGKDSEKEATLNVSQLGGCIKYAWYTFGSGKPNFYGGFGASLLYLKEFCDDETEKGNSFGFFLKAGAEIPIEENMFLDLGWTSVWSKMEIYEENINIGNMLFHGGLIFKF